VVLISPFFLQRPAPWALRAPFAPALLCRATAARLAGTALDGATEPVYQASARNLRRGGVARAVAGALRRTSTRAARDRLQRLLDTIDLPVVVVAGERDPLLTATRHPVTVVPGAGHDVHITHPAAVAHAITNLLRDVTTSAHPTSSLPPASTR
jgi:pimeloyl-ACP methyl ester carboxylesterase